MDMQITELMKKLEELRSYAKAHGIYGVNFSSKPGSKILVADSVDFVRNTMERSVERLDEIKRQSLGREQVLPE